MKRMVLVMLAIVVTGTLAFGQTQVLSRNAVGYVKVDAERGKFALVRLDFESMDGSQGGCIVVSNLLDSTQFPADTLLYLWNYDTRQYKSLVQRDPRGGWGLEGSNLLCRGEGFWLKIPASAASNSYPVFLMGEVPDRTTAPTTTMDNVFGMNILGYPYPVDTYWTNTDLAKKLPANALLYLWVSTSNKYDGPYQKNPRGGVWDGAENLVIRPGQAFWVSTTQAVDWVEGKPYTWP